MTRKLRIDILILCLLSIISGRLSGQERLISKAAEEIQAGNFIKAEEQLEDAKKKSSESPLYSFTKFRFFESESHVKFNIDSSYFYLLKTEEIIKSLNDKELVKYCNDYQICIETISNLQINVAERAFYIYARSNSIDSLNIYKSKYTSYASFKLAEDKIDSLLYQRVETLNTIQAFESYLSSTKRGFFISEAKEKIREIAYEKAVKINTVSAFEEYIATYPEANNIKEAKNMIYELAWEETLKENKAAEYLQYQSDYPDSPFIIEAIKQYKNTAILIPFIRQKGEHSVVYEYVDYILKKTVFDQKFEYAEPFGEDNLAIVRAEGEGVFGVINKEGQWVISNKYVYIERGFKNTWICDKVDGTIEVIDNQSKIIFQVKSLKGENLEEMHTLGDSCYIAKLGDMGEGVYRKDVIFDNKGNNLITLQYFSDENGDYNSFFPVAFDKFILVYKSINNKSFCVLLNTNGEVLNTLPWPNKYDIKPEKISKDLIKLYGNMYLDDKGNVVHPVSNELEVMAFSEGLFLIQDKNTKLYGYTNEKGVQIIPARFSYASVFSEGLAAVQVNKNGEKLWSFIDTNGLCKITTNLKVLSYDISEFHNGIAWAMLKSSSGIIDNNVAGLKNKAFTIKSTGEINPYEFPTYDRVYFFNHNIGWVRDNNQKWYVFDFINKKNISDGIEDFLSFSVEASKVPPTLRRFFCNKNLGESLDFFEILVQIDGMEPPAEGRYKDNYAWFKYKL